MVALNVQCSMFNGESAFQLPARSIAALARGVRLLRLALVVEEPLLYSRPLLASRSSTSEAAEPSG